MAVRGLLQLQPELGICRNPRSGKQLKYSLRRGDSRLPATGLSPSGQSLFAIQFLESIKEPTCSIPLRYKSLCCHASLFGVHFTNSCTKTVSTAFTRSYYFVQGSPSFTKLAAAIGVVVFALWGLEPLVQSSRNLFIYKNDNNWRKTTAHYALTSYFQPVLLWTAAMLVCRAMDPVYMPTDAGRLVKQRLLTFVRSLSTVVSFAYCLSCAIQQAQKSLMQTPNPSDARNMGFQFAGKAVYTAVWVAAVSLFMELLGFSAQKWLTAGGLGTVLLTLAGREIFTNFLSSIMIHATRPFVLNEWIQTKIEGYEVSGTVEHVGWWSPTIIRGEDREAIHIPNHKFTVNVVRNLTQKIHWRVKTHLAISHLDVNKINNIVADMRKVIAKNPQIEQQKLHRRVFLDIVDPENQALLILVSCFVKTSHHEEYLCVKEAILLDLLRVISHHRARLATPIRTIQKVYTDADMENIPLSSGAASRRPFLLIEPSYKINGEDRAKPPRPARAGGDQDNRGTGQQSTTDSKMDAKLRGKPASESKSKETSKSGAKVDAANADAQKDANCTATSALKADDKQTVKPPISTFISEKESKVSDTVLNASGTAANLDKKSGSVEAHQSDKVDSSTESREKIPDVPSSTILPQSEQGEKPPTTQPVKAGPALEENIVLGVALEGSKRTLPIDDDHPPPPAEAKEAATNRSPNGNVRGTPASTSTSEEDEKDK